MLQEKQSSIQTFFRDMLVSMRDIIGGRSRAYEQALEKRGKYQLKKW